MRDGNVAVHYVSEEFVVQNGNEETRGSTLPFEPGRRVSVELDWDRRSDHMLQHSGKADKANQDLIYLSF